MSTPNLNTNDKVLKSLHGKTLVFYNVENLYDTHNDPRTKDDEFTPNSPKKWDSTKYHFKIKNLAKVLSEISIELPIFIGLSEVENETVIKDLIQSKPLLNNNYEIILSNGKDERGMEVAFLFDRNYFKKLGQDSIHIDLSTVEHPDFTRDILHVYGEIFTGEKIHFFVNHWPSRREGREWSEPKRVKVAQALRHKIDFILKEDINANIVVMGDFNDNPANISVAEVLMAKRDMLEMQDQDLFNLHYRYHLEHKGTLVHQGLWDLFDQIIVSKNMLKEARFFNEHSGKIFYKKWLLFKTRDGDHAPHKTYSGDRYHQGYSDHLPVYAEFL